MFRLRAAVAVSVVLLTAAAAPVRAEIASASLRIEGISLEVETVAVTTGVDIPTTVQTEFGGKKNDEAPAVEGLLAYGDLTGPGIETPIQLTTAPGHRFQIPGFAQKGLYYLQNVRLMKGSEFVLAATPSVAAITVADLLQTSVTVRQLTPDELRSRGIVLGESFDVYEYSFSVLVDGQTVVIPFPVAIDPRTHEVTPIRSDTPYSLPPVTQIKPPRWTPPEIIPFELPVDPEAPEPENPPAQSDRNQVVARPHIAAALVLPNSLAVLHQFFGVILTVSNGAPAGSTVRLEDIGATIRVPPQLRTAKSEPSVAFGQPVPIVDASNGVTFLVAQAKGEAEWTLEGLTPGTHTVEIDVRATYREEGQQPVRLRGTPRASIVIHDARFNINFSHPDTVRSGLDYSTYTFVTNTSAAQQTIRVSNGLPSCDQNPTANVCRLSGAESDEITLASGEMRMIEYKLRSTQTGRIFATAGTIDSENLSAAVQLHMGVSETGVPLSPATLVLPHYAQFLSPSFLSAQLQLLGLGYSVATAPVTATTATFPRVIKTDVFYRAVDISRAGQKIFIAGATPATTFDAIANLSLDLLGNGVELSEWDELRREMPSGRVAGAATTAELNAAGMAGRSTVGEFVDAFASATAHRGPYVAAIAHGPAAGTERPYAVALRTLAGSLADVPNEASSGWKRTLAFADISRFDVPTLGRAGEMAMLGRWASNLELIVTPSVSGPLSVELIFPDATNGGHLRAHFDLTGTAGVALRIPLSIGDSTLQAILPNGGTAAVATASPVAVPPLRAVAARQDLHLDAEGHKVSVLFNRPVDVPEGTDLLAKFRGTIDFNRDGVILEDRPRPIFAAAMQDAHDVVNLSFEHVLTTNASYTILEDLSGQTIVPKIDNDRPAGILYGKFLKGDNTPIAAAEVRLYTGHYRGCEAGLFDDEPPPDCNPYREAPQYASTHADGTFLFEYVPRDPIGDPGLTGGYRLLGVNTDGRFTIVNGAVRLPGSVHFVNLQLLGRGAAEGTVRYDNGQRVADAEVFVGSTMFNSGRRTSTDANGSFRVEDLPVGPITFSAKDAAGNIAFAAGEIATPGQVAQKDLVIVRQPFPGTGTVFGVVKRSDDGAPVAGARVGVFSQGYGLSETFTDAAGKYEFRKVPAGFVTVLAADWTIAVDSATYDLDLRADESRELPPLILPIRSVNTQVATVNGIVVREDPLHPGDAVFYQRVNAAVVKLGDRPPATTDSEGRFTFEGIPLPWGGVVNLQAYDPETKRVGKVTLPALTETGPNNVSVFLPANSYGEGLIRVLVLDAHGNPAPGFRVVRPEIGSLISTGPGIHEYRNALVGVTIPLYAVNGPAAYGDQFAHGTARLSFPGQIATLALRLPGDGTVRVKMRSDLDLIGDVAIRYSVWDDAEQGLAPKIISASSEVNGQADWATFQNVPALQSYTVESLHAVYGYASATAQLAYDGDLIDHVLQLNRLSTVRGAVYAIDGVTPIAGATVRIEDGRRDPGPQQTGPDGTFTFHDVPASASFRVIAESTQSGIFRTGIAYGTTPPSGGPRDGIAVILRRRGSVEGRVVYKDYKVYDPVNAANNIADDTATLADNAPVPLAKFWMRELAFPSREFGTNTSPLSTDAAGRFAIPNIFVGPLRARSWDAGNQDLEGTWTGELTEEGQTLSDVYIGVGDGGIGSIAVTVADPNQQNLPIPNAEVSVNAGGRLFDLASTDGTGVAHFEQVPVGNYSVSAFSKSLGKLGASAAFVVARDATTEIRVLLEFSGKVTGTLIDPETIPANEPVPGAAVTLTGSNYQTRSSTDGGGAFLFEGVREGLFRLDAKDTRSNRRVTATRTLSATDPEPDVDLELERTDTLHVAVYLPDDTGASSGVLAPPVEVTATQRGGDYVRTVQANPAQLPGLFKSEPYEVSVRELGGEQRTMGTRSSFPAGSSANPITFVYRAYGSIEVRVTQGGAAAAGARVDVGGGGRNVALFTGPDGRAFAHQMPLGPVSAQARSLDNAFSGSASGTLTRTSVPLILDIDLGNYAGVTGFVEAEAGGPSIGTRVLASFDGRTLEMSTDGDGRYTFQGIRTQTGATTSVQLVYVGPDGVTVGAQQTVGVTTVQASQIVSAPTVRLDATPPQLLAVSPEDGAIGVAPDSYVRFTFSERIRPEHLTNAHFQLVAAGGSGQVNCSFDPPAIQADGRVIITMRPPLATPYPLKSNTLYRIIVSAQVSDLTGHTLGTPRGLTFTTSDYAEPRVIRVVPAAGTPASRAQTFEFHFSEAIDAAPWQTGGTGALRFFKLAAAGGNIVAERPGRAFLDPANPARLMFGPDDPLEAESFYRIVFSGVRDLQGNALAEQTFEFFSFDETAPFVNFVSPVPEGISLVSGVEYTLGVDLRNATATGTTATDVASVDWLRVDGTTETFLTRITASPFGYRFVAPEAPAEGTTFTLRAIAVDRSGNLGAPATIALTVKANAAPANIAIALTPSSAYPGNAVTAGVTFEDEGIAATLQVTLRATKSGGAEHLESKTKQLTRTSVTSPWPAADLLFTLPPDLATATPATFTAVVTDVRGLSASATQNLTLTPDNSAPTIVLLSPAAETRFSFNQQYRAEAVVSDAETGVAEVVFAIDGQIYRVFAPASTAGPSAGTRKFTSPPITVPAKNVDTRISIVATAIDHQGNSTPLATEVIYAGVNDPAIPKAAWICPVDHAALPAAQTSFTMPLRVQATDDIAVTAVRFLVPGVTEPLIASRVGSSDVYAATATFATPPAGEPFVITAEISDADPAHTIQLPISIDLVEIDLVIDAPQAVTSSTLSSFEGKSVLVRSATGLLVTHVPVTLRNLVVLDGGRVESPATTTSIEHRVDITIADHLYVACDSAIDVSAKGYLGGWGVNADGSNTRNESALGRTTRNDTAGGAQNAGASHGGLGALASGGSSNSAYGSITEPVTLGSGGGGAATCCSAGGSGGGAIALRGALARFAIAGAIRADGGSGTSGGSGGSVRIAAKQLILGAAAVVSADGGDAAAAGGGGRVSVGASERLEFESQLAARGGTRIGPVAGLAAAPGTIFVQRPSQAHGELLVAGHSTAATRATPIRWSAGDPARDSLVFDRVVLGPQALARFDDSVTINGVTDDRNAATVDPTAVLLLPTDVPIASMTTIPAAGSDLIRATDLEIALDASSMAGLAEAQLNLTAAQLKVETIAGYPTAVTGRVSKIAIPFDAPLGAATLAVRITDRADRFVDVAPAPFAVADNTSPVIDAFTTVPDALYPGSSVIATVSATDDVRITKLGVNATIGTAPPVEQSITPNSAAATHAFTVTVPIATAAGTPMSIEAAVEDGFPLRAATKLTRPITILPDQNPPAVTISEPAAGQSFNEAGGATFTVRALATDAEVGIRTITAKAGSGLPVPMTLSGGAWVAVLPVPNVDGTAPVPVTVTVVASDYAGNDQPATVQIMVVPLNDPSAPAMSWKCGATGAMAPANAPMKLRAFAQGRVDPATGVLNDVVKVEFFIGSDTTALLATSMGANEYEATWNVPDLPDGTAVGIRAVATSRSGVTADISSSVTVVKSNLPAITANLTIDASNAATYANQTLIVQSGVVTIVGAQTFARLVVLGGSITHPAGGANSLQLTITDTAFVACGGAIDASGRGYAPGQSDAGATTPAGDAGGSHIGRGGIGSGTWGSTFGSIYRPREAGGGASASNGSSGNGGGVVRIHAGPLIVDGAIRANGVSPSFNPGAGGSIWITAETVGGTGIIEANGGSNHRHGGGGAIAIEYREHSTLPAVRAMTGTRDETGTNDAYGGPGTFYVHGPTSTFGDLVFDNRGKFGQAAELPALGQGIAQPGTSGNTLVTDRASDIAPYFAGHWVEIRRGDALLGTWRVATISARTVTLDGAMALQPGDSWQGVYRFDSMQTVNGETYNSADPIRLGANETVHLVGPAAAGRYLNLFDPIVAGTVTVRGNVAVPSITAGMMTVESNGILSPPRTNPATLELDVSGTLTIHSGGAIDASGRGYAPGQSDPGATVPAGDAGGSHIGRGGIGSGTWGSTFGSVYRPREAGGGASASNGSSGNGGGVVRIHAGPLIVDGAIRANGVSPSFNPGAGGSIWITAETVGGTGIIEANGGSNHRHGGGGAIAIEYRQPSTLPTVRVMTGTRDETGTHDAYGGPGTTHVHGPSSTFGDLVLDNRGKFGQAAELPSLGRGTAQNGTSANTLVTDRTSDIAPSFAGHWVEIKRGDALLGTWRIATISARTVTLDGATTLQPGDSWYGVYRLDALTLRSTRLVTQDQLRVTVAPDLGAGSSIVGNNAGPPVVNAGLIRIEQRPTGLYVVGDAGAVTDTDTPVTVFVRNATGGVFTTAVSADGSFGVQVFGAAGEAITLWARDGNFFPLDSASIPLGTLPAASSTVTQISRSAWAVDSAFRSQTIAADGTILALASATAGSDRLVVLDTTSPDAPVHVRTIATGAGGVRDLDVVNGWAYIAGDRLAVVDLNVPDAPVRLADVDPPGAETTVAIVDGYAFTARDSINGEVNVYDISDPAAPRYLSTQTVGANGGTFTDLMAWGPYLVAMIDNAASQDVRLFDRRSGPTLTPLGALNIDGFNARRGHIAGSYLYAVAPGSAELAIIDLATPNALTLAGRLSLPVSGGGHVQVAAGVAFVANLSGGLVAISTNPADLRVLGSVATTGIAQDVALASGRAYVANENGIAIVPVTIGPVIDARRIQLSRTGGTVTVAGSARSITGTGALTGSIDNVATITSSPLQLAPNGSFSSSITAVGGQAIRLRVSDGVHAEETVALGVAPFAAEEINVHTVVPGDAQFLAQRLAIDGATTVLTNRYAVSTTAVSTGAFLFRQPNASEPAQIVTAPAADGRAGDVAARDGFAFTAGARFSTLNYLNSIPTMNLANPDPSGAQFAVALAGNYAFVAGDLPSGSSEGTIYIYDVSSPTAPLFVRAQDIHPGFTTRFLHLIPFETDKLIAISDSTREVTILDISNINALDTIAVYDIPGFTAATAALDGSTLYVAGPGSGIAVVDLSNPSAPQHLSTIATPGHARAVAALDADTIVAADGGRGLTFLDTSTRSRPVLLGSQPLQGNTVDVKVVNGYIHVATETRYYVLRP